MQRDFLGESHPPTGERPEGVLGGRDGRVDGARSESGAAREQAVIGEIVEGFSQDGRGLHDDLLQRVHRRGARFHGGIPCDLELADHLDGAVRGLGDGRRLPREQGPRRHLGVDGVGLAGGAACTAVAPIHFHDMMPGSVDGPCQASAVAPGAFDPERLNPPVCLGPRDQSLVATRVRDERVIAQTDPQLSIATATWTCLCVSTPTITVRALGGVVMRLVTDWPPRIAAPSWSGWADRTVTGRGYSRPLLGHGHPVSWLPYELPAGDDRQVSSVLPQGSWTVV